MCVTLHLSDRSVHHFATPDEAAAFVARRREMAEGRTPKPADGDSCSPRTHHLLRVLYDRRTGDPVTSNTLRGALGLTQQTVNRILRYLVAAGHVVRVGTVWKAGLYRITPAGEQEVRDATA